MRVAWNGFRWSFRWSFRMRGCVGRGDLEQSNAADGQNPDELSYIFLAKLRLNVLQHDIRIDKVK